MSKHSKKSKSVRSCLITEVRHQAYHGGPDLVMGKRARFRAGIGIRKVGDSRPTHGPVRLVVKDGVRVEAAASSPIVLLKDCALSHKGCAPARTQLALLTI